MKFAIVESVVTPGGHEIDYDRILVEELSALGHEVEFYVPEGHQFKWNYGVAVHKLEGEGVSYKGSKGLKKLYLAIKEKLIGKNGISKYLNLLQKRSLMR